LSASNEHGSPAARGAEHTAVVAGKALEIWPRDLYIPPEALEVFLESFHGPLDLLLYLIRKQNIDILDIPVAEITKQYMEYVEMMHRMRLDLAAEYLLMAATLAEIKSRMLVPRPQPDGGEEEDPRAALVRRLQAYERYREAADRLSDRPRLERDLFVVHAAFDDEARPERHPDVNIDELVAAFRNVVELSARNRHWVVGREVLSVRERMTEILSRLNEQQFLRFEQLFEPAEGRMGLVVTFVAILELVRERTLVLVQNEALAPIHVRAA
jgi:segregation and condensation protein A